MIEFTVIGDPKPAGSKRAFVLKSTGRAIIADACTKSKDWKATVQAAALDAYQGDPIDGPIAATILFVMRRPKSHYRKNGELKPDAPHYHTSKPDATKLWRCAEDALTGIAWRDDAQVVMQQIEKVYERPGHRIGMVAKIESAAAWLT